MTSRLKYVLLVCGILVIAVFLSFRKFSKPESEAVHVAANLELETSLNALTNAEIALVDTNQFRSALISEFNRFVILAAPYALEKPITPADVVSVMTNNFGNGYLLGTETHFAEIDKRGALRFFMSNEHSSYSRKNPDERKNWYRATAKWTKKEALAETYRILERLGIHLAVSKEEAEPFEIAVKNPDSERVNVTPFYTVKLYNTNNSMVIEAEFRLGESGPGRLTRWFDNIPRIKR